MNMKQYASNKMTIGEAVAGGLLVVAQWEAKEGQADKVADILHRFLPEAQSEPGAKLFLIGRNKDNPAQFLFYELFRDEAALKAHQESAYFKTYIAGQALPLLTPYCDPSNARKPPSNARASSGVFRHTRQVGGRCPRALRCFWLPRT